MNLLVSFRSEILKTKRTPSLYFTLAGAGIIPFASLLKTWIYGIPPETSNDAFNAIFKNELNVLVIFPFFIILICTLIPQIEYRNNTWKQVFTSPQTKANVFFAKFLNIHLLMLLFLVINNFFLLCTAIAIHFIYPDLNLLQQPLNGYKLLVNAGNSYLFLLAVCSLQFWIGLRFKNFIFPIAIGVALWFMGTLLALDYHSTAAKYFPYSFHTYNYFPAKNSILNTIGWSSVGYSVLFLVIGFVDFRRRRMNA